jgi:hypothetical protein
MLPTTPWPWCKQCLTVSNKLLHSCPFSDQMKNVQGGIDTPPRPPHERTVISCSIIAAMPLIVLLSMSKGPIVGVSGNPLPTCHVPKQITMTGSGTRTGFGSSIWLGS